MDFDPRDSDSRDDERYESNQSRGRRGGSDDRDRDDDWSQPHIRSRDRDDDARTLGRGAGSDSRASHSDGHTRDRHHDARWQERERDHRERDVDPRDPFTCHVNLPRGLDRELVAIDTASTCCADRNRARSRLSVRFGSSRVVTCVTIMIGPPIHGPAIFAISAKKG
jgi:hypothetical protein